jgi:hypothetical protein
MKLSDIDVAGVSVLRSLHLSASPPPGIPTVAGSVLGPGDRIEGEPGDYRLIAWTGVEIPDDVRDVVLQAHPHLGVNDGRPVVEMVNRAVLFSIDDDATPTSMSQDGPALTRPTVRVVKDGMLQSMVNTSRCELPVETVDGVARVVARVRGERVELDRLQAWRDVVVEDWPELARPVRVRVVYELPPTHPAALLLARTAVGSPMLVNRMPSELQALGAFSPSTDRTPVARRKPRSVKHSMNRDNVPPRLGPEVGNVVVELDPVSQALAYGTRGRKSAIRPGDVALFLPFDRQEGPIKDIPKMVQACIAATDLNLCMSIDSMTAAALAHPDRLVVADWKTLARERYGGTDNVNPRQRKRLQQDLGNILTFGLRIRWGDGPPKQAKLFLSSVEDVQSGRIDVVVLNPALFERNQFGVGLPDGLLRLDPQRDEWTIRLGRYLACRFSMTPQARASGQYPVKVGTLLASAGIDAAAVVENRGRGVLVERLEQALVNLRDGVGSMSLGMLSTFDIDRRSAAVVDWLVTPTAAQRYLRAIDPARTMPKPASAALPGG